MIAEDGTVIVTNPDGGILVVGPDRRIPLNPARPMELDLLSPDAARIAYQAAGGREVRVIDEWRAIGDGPDLPSEIANWRHSLFNALAVPSAP